MVGVVINIELEELEVLVEYSVIIFIVGVIIEVYVGLGK